MTLVNFMQKKFANRIRFKSARRDFLMMMCNKFLDELDSEATKLKSLRMMEIVSSMRAVPKEILDYLLSQYLEQMQKLSWIAFY